MLMSAFAAMGMGALNTLIGNASQTFGSGRYLRDTQRRENLSDLQTQQQLEVAHRTNLNMADYTSRIEAAKANGMHPLTALGVNIQGSSAMLGTSPDTNSEPVSAGSQAYINSVIAREQVKEIKANTRRAEADADMAEIQVAEAQKRLVSQAGNPPIPFQAGSGLDVIYKSDEATRTMQGTSGGLAAGIHPGSKLVMTTNGPIVVPDQSVGDSELAPEAIFLSELTGLSPEAVSKLGLATAMALAAIPAGRAAKGMYKAYKAYKAPKPFKPFRK